MEVFVNHYLVLGLPPGEEVAKLSNAEIAKAYRSKALELHPDKRPDDPDAHQKFQNLHQSYEILKDEEARKLFDDVLMFRLHYQKILSQLDLKKCKMKRCKIMSDRSPVSTPDNDVTDDETLTEEDKAARKLKDQIDKLRAT